MYKREEVSLEEFRAISKKVRRKIIFLEKIIYNGKLKKTYFFIVFTDEQKNKYFRLYENIIRVHNLVYNCKRDFRGEEKKTTKKNNETIRLLNYLGLS